MKPLVILVGILATAAIAVTANQLAGIASAVPVYTAIAGYVIGMFALALSSAPVVKKPT